MNNSDKNIIGITPENNDFREIFYKYHGRLVLYANKFLNDLELSRDVVQDVFYNLWKRPEVLLSDYSIKSYLFKAVKNGALNNIRHLKVIHNTPEKLFHDPNSPDYNTFNEKNDPLTTLLEEELLEKVEDIIENLPEKCRIIFKLSRQEQLKNKEIADQLGVSVKMVEKQMTKALKVFRKELAEYLL
ncbi:MAG: RNA polymerase sigma-70 factor [Chlorobi bacterium]|nr:RNA polymerase sigma-70 factor [Chlorobiota bacterium]